MRHDTLRAIPPSCPPVSHRHVPVLLLSPPLFPSVLRSLSRSKGVSNAYLVGTAYGVSPRLIRTLPRRSSHCSLPTLNQRLVPLPPPWLQAVFIPLLKVDEEQPDKPLGRLLQYNQPAGLHTPSRGNGTHKTLLRPQSLSSGPIPDRGSSRKSAATQHGPSPKCNTI